MYRKYRACEFLTGKQYEDIFRDELCRSITLGYPVKPEPERLLKSGNVLIVFWKDGSKTVVKCAKDKTPNDYVAFTAALAKKIYGSNSAVKHIVATAETREEERKESEK